MRTAVEDQAVHEHDREVRRCAWRGPRILVVQHDLRALVVYQRFWHRVEMVEGGDTVAAPCSRIVL